MVRASVKRNSPAGGDEGQSVNHPVTAQGNAHNETPRKRARLAKSTKPTQPIKGGWDELPHALGSIHPPPEDAGISSPKETTAPVISAGDAPSPDGGPATSNGTDIGQANGGTASTGSPQIIIRLKVKEADSHPHSPHLDEKKGVAGKSTGQKGTQRKTKDNPHGLMFGQTPYLNWRGPSIEECEEVHRLLTEAHGEVAPPVAVPRPSITVAGCGEVPSVLDALMRTMLSGATTMNKANEAISSLAHKYGTARTGIGRGSVNWNRVRLGSLEELIETIKRGGLANKKSADMKQILDMVWAEQGKMSLDHLHGKPAPEAMQHLVQYPGVGIKTAACVILFCLREPCLAVDTHVHRLSKWLGWVPGKASPDKAFWHVEYLVPDRLKYGLHQLFIRHGQTCGRCKAKASEGTQAWNNTHCVLEHLLERKEPISRPKLIVNTTKEGVVEAAESDGVLSESQADSVTVGAGAKVVAKAAKRTNIPQGAENAVNGVYGNDESDSEIQTDTTDGEEGVEEEIKVPTRIVLVKKPTSNGGW